MFWPKTIPKKCLISKGFEKIYNLYYKKIEKLGIR